MAGNFKFGVLVKVSFLIFVKWDVHAKTVFY